MQLKDLYQTFLVQIFFVPLHTLHQLEATCIQSSVKTDAPLIIMNILLETEQHSDVWSHAIRDPPFEI